MWSRTAFAVIFPTGNHDLSSNFLFLYYWAFYAEFVRFISNGTLVIVSAAGEGVQAVVYKVRSASDPQQVFALKIYKDSSLCM